MEAYENMLYYPQKTAANGDSTCLRLLQLFLKSISTPEQKKNI